MNRTIAVICLCLCAITRDRSVGACQTVARQGEELQAARPVTNDATEQHIAELQRVVEADPHNANHLMELARAYHSNLDAVHALEIIRQIYELGAATEDVRLLHAEILSLQEDWINVIRVLSPIAGSTESYDICHLLADAYRRRNNLIDASWYYEQAVRLRPAALEDLKQLASIHLKRGLPALAIRALESAIEQGHVTAQIHFELAQAYYAAGRVLGKPRIEVLRDAIAGTTYKQWYVFRAIPGQPDRYEVCASNCAIYHLQRAFELNLEDPAGYLLNADIWFKAQRFEQARDIYEAIEELVPRQQLGAYHFRYGMTLLALGDPQGLETHLQQALQLDPASISPKALEAYVKIADFYCLRGNLERTITYLKRASAEAPRSAELRYRLANALMEADRPAEARVHYLATLQLEPLHHDRERMLKIIGQEGQVQIPED